MVEKYFLETDDQFPICIQYSSAKEELVIGGHMSLRDSIDGVFESLLELEEPPEITTRANKLRMTVGMTYKVFRRLTGQMRKLNYGLQHTAAFNRAM